uniref:Uncharacterized protein n=1 Tax=Pararge aegeria TaxID=116150 RepID=S4P6Q6_9NEOP
MLKVFYFTRRDARSKSPSVVTTHTQTLEVSSYKISFPFDAVISNISFSENLLRSSFRAKYKTLFISRIFISTDLMFFQHF